MSKSMTSVPWAFTSAKALSLSALISESVTGISMKRRSYPQIPRVCRFRRRHHLREICVKPPEEASEYTAWKEGLETFRNDCQRRRDGLANFVLGRTVEDRRDQIINAEVPKPMIIDWKNISPKTHYIPVTPKPGSSDSKTPTSPQAPTHSM